MPVRSQFSDGTLRILFENESVVDRSFSDEQDFGFVSIGSTFTNCDFRKVRFLAPSFGAGWTQSVYKECVFDQAKLRILVGGNARFEGCSFKSINFSEWSCENVELVDCVFTGILRNARFDARVREEKVSRIGRRENLFQHNDFSQLDMRQVSFRGGIKLSNQQLPAGPDYIFLADAAGALRLARERISSWDEEDLKKPVLQLVDALDQFRVNTAQVELLVRPKNFGKRPAIVLDGLERAVRP